MKAITASGEQRGAVRVAAPLPVEIDGAPGRVRDISASGVYVETEAIGDFGPIVGLTLTLHTDGEWRTVTCDARVVRVEVHGNRLGIAARLPAPLLEAAGAQLRPARRRRR